MNPSINPINNMCEVSRPHAPMIHSCLLSSNNNNGWAWGGHSAMMQIIIKNYVFWSY